MIAQPAFAGLEFYAPTNGGVVLGDSVVVDVRGCEKKAGSWQTTLNGNTVPLTWRKGPYPKQWLAELSLDRSGKHELNLDGKCPGKVSFFSSRSGVEAIARELAARFISKHPARKLAWDWGPAVFLYGLYRLDPQSAYVREFQERWAEKGIKSPDRNDACPAALTSLALARDQGNLIGMSSALTVADYLRNEPKNRLGALDHLGHAWTRIFFGESIWVDSLMMVGVFGAQWGNFTRDAGLLEFAASQPAIYATALQDPATGLFRHAWLLKESRAIPKSKTFWLRGNGWVIAAIADIVDELPFDHPRREEMLGIFRRTVEGLKPYQQETGLWDSLANLPGETYGETSGSALVAYAVAKGVHRGWLPPSDMIRAKRAFAGVTARLHAKPTKSGARQFSMPRISWFTNPGTRFLYSITPAVADMSYGVGAYLMAAAELKNEEF